MMTTDRLLGRVVWSHVVRGATLAVLGALAITWPELALPVSMRVAGVVVSLSGLADVALAVRLRSTFRAWPLIAGNGVACAAFGILTVALGGVAPGLSMRLAALWLLLYGLVAGLLALALWPLSRARTILTGVAVGLVATAAAARWVAEMPPFVALYLGAFFAVLLGAFHVAAGLWIRRVVIPEFTSTAQAAWMPADPSSAGTHRRSRPTEPPPS